MYRAHTAPMTHQRSNAAVNEAIQRLLDTTKKHWIQPA